MAEGLGPGQAERASGRRLARMDGLDPRPVDLRDVGRVDEGERNRGPEERVIGNAGEAQAGDPEAEYVDCLLYTSPSPRD